MSGIGKYLYDTDVIIDYLKGEIMAKELLENAEGRQSISVITVSELYAGVRNGKDELIIKGLTEYFLVIDINKEISVLGGKLKSKYHKSHGVALPNALIAATAEHHLLELKTLNIKHYPMIKNLKPAYKKGVGK